MNHGDYDDTHTCPRCDLQVKNGSAHTCTLKYSLQQEEARQKLREHIAASLAKGFPANGVLLANGFTCWKLGIELDKGGHGTFEGRAVHLHDWIQEDYVALFNPDAKYEGPRPTAPAF